MSTTVSVNNVATAYATRPGYQPVPQGEFHEPPPPAYTPSPGYAPAPSYFPQQQPYPQPSGYTQQQSTNNVVVVQQSAAPVIPVIARPAGYIAEAGQTANVFAIMVTIFAFVFGCWWSVLCSIPAIIFANSASEAGRRGDADSVRSNNSLSYGCTIAAIVSGVVGVAACFGLVFGVIYNGNTY